MSEKRVSVIIVTYNTQEMTAECIDSLCASERCLDFEIILWDNASSDGSRERFEVDARISYFYSCENLGFPEANNRALAHAKGEYVLFLNSDTICHPGSISSLLEQYECCLASSKCAIAPTLLNKDGSLQRSYFRYPTLSKTLVAGLGLHATAVSVVSRLLPKQSFELQFGAREKVFEVDYAILACNLIKREYVDRVDALDKNFFFYHDDCDFGYRLKRAGIQQKIFKGAQITHLGGQSSSSFDIFRLRNYYRSLIYFFFKHCSRKKFAIFAVFLTLLFIVRTIGALFFLRFSLAVPSTYVRQEKGVFFSRKIWRDAISTNLKIIFAPWSVRTINSRKKFWLS